MSTIILLLIVTVLIVSTSSAPSKAAAGWNDLPWDFEGAETNLKVTGTLPSWLKGSLYRIGPGIWRFGQAVENPHWFGGLGFAQAFHFDGTQNVSYYCSFINSSEYNQYDPNSNYTQKMNSPNTQVTIRKVNGNLLANDGNPLSNSFDAITTKTIEHPYIYEDEYMPNPIYNEACPSHSQIAPNGEVFHFLYVFSENTTDHSGYYQLYHIPPGTNKRIMAPNKVYPNKNWRQPLFQHMHGLTEHFMVLCEVPFNLMDGQWEPQLGVVSWYVVDKYTAEMVAEFTSDLFMYYHWANTYEYINETNGELNIVVDIIIDINGSVYDALYINQMVYNWTWSLDMFCTGNFSRFVLPLNQSGSKVSPVKINPYNGVEMPVINYDKYNTREHKYVWQVGVRSCDAKDPNRSQFWDSLFKTTVSFDGNGETLMWTDTDNGNNTYLNEPIFVGNPGGTEEDDGLIMAEAMDSTTNSSFLMVLDASNMKEVARIEPSVIKTIPFGFHGRYYPN